MTQPRLYAGAIVTPDGSGLWITGGRDPKTESTEYVYPGQEPVQGPNLPQAVYLHCLIQLDMETYMILGGSNPSGIGYTSQTFLFHSGNESFTPGPFLTRAKRAACEVIMTGDGDKVVIVAGGFTGSTVLDEIESWPVGSSQNFTKLDVSLPREIEAAKAVVTEDHTNIVFNGGLDETAIFKINCSSATNCNVEEMEQKLKLPHGWPVNMLVPDSLANCQENK